MRQKQRKILASFSYNKRMHLFIFFFLTWMSPIHTATFQDLLSHAKDIAPKSSDQLYEKAIAAARKYRDYDRSREKPLLCAVFLHAAPASISVLQQNMRAMTSYCSGWAAVCYGGDPSLLLPLQREASNYHTSLVHISLTNDTLLHWHPPVPFPSLSPLSLSLLLSFRNQSQYPPMIPKPLLYLQLVPLLSQYRRVWLLDEDLSLSLFNISLFLHILSCHEHPSPPLLISQPLISSPSPSLSSSRAHTLSSKPKPAPIGQHIRYLNSFAWNNLSLSPSLSLSSTHPLSLSNSHSISVEFIEQQAPMLDSLFLHWFSLSLITPLSPVVRVLSSDWSFDDLWCRAAALFSREAYNHTPRYLDSCLLVLPLSLTHLNLKTLNYTSSSKSRKEFYHRGITQHWIIRQTFPLLFVPGRRSFDPLLERNREEAIRRAFFSLSPSCRYDNG